uniref:N-acetyltransferase domain-containing protein n=1 Tax=Arcella intermedia TaxID=1963864 RepID=A0A6B2LIY5_9EUKA
MGWYYKKCIQYSFRYGRSYNVSNSEEKVVGVIIWQHPHETNASLSRMIEVGMSDMPRVFGFEGTYKFSVSFKSVQQKRKELMKKEEHMYLFAIGVDPPYQRQGYGSALIQPLLKEADDSNLKCFLECSIAESVSFFKKWGFQVIEEVSKHHTGCLTYEMVRKPKSEQ